MWSMLFAISHLSLIFAVVMEQPVNPYVSVIMPVYNAAGYLDRSVRSVLGQTDGDLELICFNDASTDESSAILHRFAEADPRVRVIDSAVNVKQGGGRNRAMAAARGRYILFLDADDWLREDAVELCRAAATGGDADLVFFDYVRSSPTTGSESPCSPLGDDATGMEGEALLKRVARRQTSIWSAMYDRRLFSGRGLTFPEGVFYEDNAIALAVQLGAQRPVKISEGLYYYRVDNGSVTRSLDNPRFFDRIESAVTLLNHLKRLGLYESYRDEIDNVFINQYYIHTVTGCVYRFSRVPMDRLRQVRQGIGQYMPGWRRNPYYHSLPVLRRLKIELHARFPRAIHLLVHLKRLLGGSGQA